MGTRHPTCGLRTRLQGFHPVRAMAALDASPTIERQPRCDDGLAAYSGRPTLT
jgi:hypothetical protein